MENTEKEIYEAFGLEYTGEKEAEAAEPQKGIESEGEKGQEITEPADPGEDNTTSINSKDTGANDQGENKEETKYSDAEKQSQSRDERAKHAAARRKAEQQAAIKAAVAEAESASAREIEEILSLGGVKDPDTGKPIKTAEEYRAAKAKIASKRQNEIIKKSGLDREEVEEYISMLPEVREAREGAERAARAASEAQLAHDIEEISKLDGSIKTKEDLVHHESFDKIYERVSKHGDSLVDAFKFVNADALAERRLNAAMAAERQKSLGKDHLVATAQRGGSSVEITRDEIDAYRAFMPDASDAEILRYHEKYKKRKG